MSYLANYAPNYPFDIAQETMIGQTRRDKLVETDLKAKEACREAVQQLAEDLRESEDLDCGSARYKAERIVQLIVSVFCEQNLLPSGLLDPERPMSKGG